MGVAILSAPVYGEDVDVTERFLLIFIVVIFMSPQLVSQMSTDILISPAESWIPEIMGCGAVGADAGRRKSEFLSPWYFHSCSMDLRLGL